MRPTEAEDGRCHLSAAIHNTPENPQENHHSPWGDTMGMKSQNCCRIVLQNPSGLGVNKRSEKTQRIREFIENKHIDILGLPEVNVNWYLTEEGDSLWNRTRTWFEGIKISVAHNTKDSHNSTRHQFGGNAIITRNKLSY